MFDANALAATVLIGFGLSMFATGCGSGSDDAAIKSEPSPFPAFNLGQKLKRCSGKEALHVGGFDLRVAGRLTCEEARPLVKGFAPHSGETVQRLHGFTCYSRPEPKVGIIAVCIDGDRVFRFNFG